MTLVQVFDSPDAAPEEARPHLVQVGEKHVFYDVEKDPRIAALKNAYERVKGEATTKGDKLKGLEATLADTAAKLEELEKGGRQKGGEEYEAKLAQVRDKYEAQLKAVQSERERLTGQLDTTLRRNAAIEAITAAKGNVKLLLPHVLERTKLSQDGEQLQVHVVDEKGNPRIADTLGTPLSIAGLVEELKKSDEFAPAFDGTGAAGSGAQGGGGGGGAGSATRRSDLQTDAEKSAFITKHGYDAYIALPA